MESFMSRLFSPPFSAAMVMSLMGIAVGNVWLHFLENDFVVVSMLFAAIPVALGVLFLMRLGWVPAAIAAVSLFYIVGELTGTPAVYRLAHPAELTPFLATTLELVSQAAAAIIGVTLAVQRSVGIRVARNRDAADV
jgi:hypothetical protein